MTRTPDEAAAAHAANRISQGYTVTSHHTQEERRWIVTKGTLVEAITASSVGAYALRLNPDAPSDADTDELLNRWVLDGARIR